MRIFLDANIIFSAAQRGSPSHQLIKLLARHAKLSTHPGVWEEADRNLRTKRPQWTQGLAMLLKSIEVHAGCGPCPEVGLPPKDQPVLAAAIANRADRLLTGDRTHFGHLFGKSVQGVKIVSPQLLVQELKTLGWVG